MDESENIVREEKDSLPDLGFKYEYIRRLGSGANDTAHIVKEVNSQKEYVALSPINGGSEQAWAKTRGKCEKVSDLEDIEGIAPYLVHEIDRGTHFLGTRPGKGSYGRDIEPNKTIIVEYGGKSIETIQDETTKLKIVRQMWDCLSKLHKGGRYIGDFKLDHWTYIMGEDGEPQLKMIDYTGVRTVHSDNPPDISNRDLNLGQFMGAVEALIPWYSTQEMPPARTNYENSSQIIEKNLKDLEQKASSYSPIRKGALSIAREIKDRTRY